MSGDRLFDEHAIGAEARLRRRTDTPPPASRTCPDGGAAGTGPATSAQRVRVRRRRAVGRRPALILLQQALRPRRLLLGPTLLGLEAGGGLAALLAQPASLGGRSDQDRGVQPARAHSRSQRESSGLLHRSHTGMLEPRRIGRPPRRHGRRLSRFRLGGADPGDLPPAPAPRPGSLRGRRRAGCGVRGERLTWPANGL